MNDKIFDKKLFDEFYDAFQPLWEIIDDQSGKNFGILNPYARRSIAEATFFLIEMTMQINLDDDESNFVQTWISQFIHVLGREFEGNFILRFHYFYKDWQKDPARTVDSMISMAVALRALEVCGYGPTRGGTVWGYFERDVPFFRKGLSWILDRNNEEGCCNELFLLLNMIELFSIIKDSTILKEECKEFIKLANGLQSQFDIAFSLSPGLKIYAADMAEKAGLTIKTNDMTAILGGKPATFLALNILRKGARPSPHILDRAQQSSATHLSWIAKAWDRYLAGGHR